MAVSPSDAPGASADDRVKRPGGSSEDAIPIGRRVLLVAAAVAALAGSPPPAAAASAESTIIVGGRARSFLLEWPALQEPRPAIIILHGAGGGIRPFADLPQRALDAGAVILVPRGIGGRWNFFPPGRESEKERASMSPASRSAASWRCAWHARRPDCLRQRRS